MVHPRGALREEDMIPGWEDGRSETQLNAERWGVRLCGYRSNAATESQSKRGRGRRVELGTSNRHIPIALELRITSRVSEVVRVSTAPVEVEARGTRERVEQHPLPLELSIRSPKVKLEHCIRLYDARSNEQNKTLIKHG